MTLASMLHTLLAPDQRLSMSELKAFSGLSRSDRDEFWDAWRVIPPARRAEIAQATVDLAEDNVELDFGELWYWFLEDDQAAVRLSAIEGLWEDTSGRVLRQMLSMLRKDPSPEARAAVAAGLSRYAYMAVLDELDDAESLRQLLMETIRDPRESLEVRRRALESAGYFANAEDVQQQVDQAYGSDEQLLRESALVAMGRSMLERWLPAIGRELSSNSPALRYEAARAAGELAEGATPLLPKLIPLLSERDTEIALAAIWALGQIGGEHARRALQQVRKSQDETRRQAAAEALDQLSLGDKLI